MKKSKIEKHEIQKAEETLEDIKKEYRDVENVLVELETNFRSSFRKMEQIQYEYAHEEETLKKDLWENKEKADYYAKSIRNVLNEFQESYLKKIKEAEKACTELNEERRRSE